MLSWVERRSIAKGMGISYIERENTEQSRPSMQESMKSLQIPISEQMKDEEIQSLKQLTDGELSGWIRDLYSLKSKTQGMDKFERRQVRRQLKAAEAEWEQRRTDAESKALREFTDEQLDEFITHFCKLKEKVGEDKTVNRQLLLAQRELERRNKRTELGKILDDTQVQLNKKAVVSEGVEEEKKIAGTTDKRYIREHLNFIYPEVYERTEITQNFRFYGPIQKIVMEKRQGDSKYTRKYNEDGGQGFADFMCILFPSSDGSLNINGGMPDRPHFKQDCRPTPKLCAQIAAFIYNYRQMNPEKQLKISQKMEEIINLLGENGIDIHAKKSNQQEKAFREQFSGLKEYIAYEELYQKACKAWKEFCQVDQKFAKIDEKGKPSEEQKKIFNDMKKGKGNSTEKKYIEFVCKLLPKIKLKKGNAVAQITLENYKEVRNFFDIREEQRQQEIKVVRETQSFFKEHMFEEHFFAEGQIIQVKDLKKASTILRLLYSATKAIDKQEYDETNAPENCIPQYTVEKMFMGYVLKGLTDNEKREEFYQEAERLIRSQTANEQEKERSQKSEDELSETEGILAKMKEKPKRFSPYTGDAVNYGEAKKVEKLERDNTQIRFGGTFSDCADTAMRHTLNLLGYSLEGNWDIYIKDMDSKLKEKLPQLIEAATKGKNFEHLSLKERLQLYFYYQSLDELRPNDDGILTRSLWEYVISNMKEEKLDKEGLRQMYSIHYVHGGNELKSGHLNSLKVIYNVARALKENGEGNLSQEDFAQFKEAQASIEKLEKVMSTGEGSAKEGALRVAIQKTYQLINPRIAQEMVIRKMESNERDVFAEVDVKIDCGDDPGVEFTVSHQDGHGEVSHFEDVPRLKVEGEVQSEYAKLLVHKYKLQDKKQEFDSFHSMYSGFGKKEDQGKQFADLYKGKRILEFLENDRVRPDFIQPNNSMKGSKMRVEFSDGKQSQCMDGYFLDHCANTLWGLCSFLYNTADVDGIKDINIKEQLENYKEHNYHVDGDVVYAINKRDHTAAFVGWNTGRNNYPEHVQILPKIEVEGKTYAVTEIRKGAFCGCSNSNLQKVTIPSSLRKIGEMAFLGCCIQELCFEENSNLEEIGANVFDNRCQIKKLMLPSSVKKIGKNMLSDLCIEEVAFAEENCLEEIEELGLVGCTFKEPVVLKKLKKIGKQAFERAHFQKLCLGEEGLERISEHAFKNAEINQEFIIPKSVKVIEKEAFVGAHIPKLSFAEEGHLEEIQNSAFISAVIEGDLIIPRSVKHIGDYAFNGCKGNTSLKFVEDGALETIGNWAFTKTNINGDLIIPKNVGTIGRGAFKDCVGVNVIRFASGGRPANLAANAFGTRQINI